MSDSIALVKGEEIVCPNCGRSFPRDDASAGKASSIPRTITPIIVNKHRGTFQPTVIGYLGSDVCPYCGRNCPIIADKKNEIKDAPLAEA